MAPKPKPTADEPEEKGAAERPGEPEAGEQEQASAGVRPAMTLEQIKAAGLAVDVPSEIPDPPTGPIEYQEGVGSEQWKPEDGWQEKLATGYLRVFHGVPEDEATSDEVPAPAPGEGASPPEPPAAA
jgi:hypothetical protein